MLNCAYDTYLSFETLAYETQKEKICINEREKRKENIKIVEDVN